MEYVQWLNQIDRASVPIAGGKGANLGEMAGAGLPVPPGFVVTVDAWSRFIDSSGLEGRIEQRLAGLNIDDTRSLNMARDNIQQWIEQAPLPQEVESAVIAAYGELNKLEGTQAEFVAVRSSGTVEDAADTSFAGMFSSFLNVRGDDAGRPATCGTAGHRCSPRARLPTAHGTRSRACPASRSSCRKWSTPRNPGVMFTLDPTTGNREHIVIEAAWGLGELVVQGDVRPDRYVVDKHGRRIIERVVSHKDAMLTRASSGDNERIELDEARATTRVLSDDEVQQLAELAIKDEAHYGVAQDAEFAIEGDHIYLVQTRPITAIAAHGVSAEGVAGEMLIRGLGASPGVAIRRGARAAIARRGLPLSSRAKCWSP